MMSTLLLWEALCWALLWSVFCRLVHVDKTTKPEVRAALVAAGVAALVGIGAPLYGWLADGVTLIVFGALVLLELVLSKNWRHGIPIQFIKDLHRPKRRAGDYHHDHT